MAYKIKNISDRLKLEINKGGVIIILEAGESEIVDFEYVVPTGWENIIAIEVV